MRHKALLSDEPFLRNKNQITEQYLMHISNTKFKRNPLTRIFECLSGDGCPDIRMDRRIYKNVSIYVYTRTYIRVHIYIHTHINARTHNPLYTHSSSLISLPVVIQWKLLQAANHWTHGVWKGSVILHKMWQYGGYGLSENINLDNVYIQTFVAWRVSTQLNYPTLHNLLFMFDYRNKHASVMAW